MTESYADGSGETARYEGADDVENEAVCGASEVAVDEVDKIGIGGADEHR